MRTRNLRAVSPPWRLAAFPVGLRPNAAMRRILPLLLPFVAFAACTSNSAGPSSGDGGSSSDDASINGDDGATGGGDDGGTGLDGDAGVPDTFAWADAFPAGNGSDILAMASDSTGVVVVGQITGTATLGTTTLTATDSEGNAFVAKLDPTGAVLWAKIASGSQSAFEAVALDASGNITLSGDDYGDELPGSTPSTFSFAGTTLTPNYASGTIGGSGVSATAGVVARLDPSGNLSWLKLAETTTEIDMGALAVSGSNVVVAGAMNGNAAFAAGETMPVTCTTSTKECVFLAAYDAATGAPKWALAAPSTPARGNAGNNPHQVQMGVDGTGSLFLGIGGYFEGVGSTDDTELVVNKYDPTGVLTWNKVFMAGGGDTPELAGFGVDTAGNSYVLGNQAAGLVLGPTTIDSNETGDFLAKLDPTGAVTWAETLDSNPGGNHRHRPRQLGLHLRKRRRSRVDPSRHRRLDEPRQVRPHDGKALVVGHLRHRARAGKGRRGQRDDHLRRRRRSVPRRLRPHPDERRRRGRRRERRRVRGEAQVGL